MATLQIARGQKGSSLADAREKKTQEGLFLNSLANQNYPLVAEQHSQSSISELDTRARVGVMLHTLTMDSFL